MSHIYKGKRPRCSMSFARESPITGEMFRYRCRRKAAPKSAWCRQCQTKDGVDA